MPNKAGGIHPSAWAELGIQGVDQPPLIPEELQLGQGVVEGHEGAVFLGGGIVAVADVEGPGSLLLGSDD